jgi:hypothetical protein
MKFQSLTAACVALVTLSFAGAALADDSVTVKLQAPVAAKAKFIAGGAVFTCEADTCFAPVATSQTFAASTCKVVAKNAGAVTSYSNPRKSLDADQISACNAAANASQVAKR